MRTESNAPSESPVETWTGAGATAMRAGNGSAAMCLARCGACAEEHERRARRQGSAQSHRCGLRARRTQAACTEAQESQGQLRAGGDLPGSPQAGRPWRAGGRAMVRRNWGTGALDCSRFGPVRVRILARTFKGRACGARSKAAVARRLLSKFGLPVRRYSIGGSGNGLRGRMVVWRGQLRASGVAVLCVVPEPGFAGLKALHDGMVGRVEVLRWRAGSGSCRSSRCDRTRHSDGDGTTRSRREGIRRSRCRRVLLRDGCRNGNGWARKRPPGSVLSCSARVSCIRCGQEELQ